MSQMDRGEYLQQNKEFIGFGQDDDILPENLEGETEMAIVICPHCDNSRQINHIGAEYYIADEEVRRYDRFDVTLLCCECERRSLFTIRRDSATLIDLGVYGQFNTNVNDKTKDIFTEAEIAFLGRAYRAAATMCRSAVENALKDCGFTRGNHATRIDNAEKNGYLTRIEYMLAHGSRLVGNKAVHTAETINPSEIPPLFSATVTIVNKLADQLTSKGKFTK